MTYWGTFLFDSRPNWLIVAASSTFLLFHVRAFAPPPLFIPVPMRSGDEAAILQPRRTAPTTPCTLLGATIVPDTQQGIPHNETFSTPKLSSRNDEAARDNQVDDETTQQQRPEFDDDFLFNAALNNLAKLAGDHKQPVIRRAVACEDMWKDFCSSPAEHWKPDTVSFNTVLKAWGKAGHVLEIQHTEHSTPNHLLDPDVPVFSAKECAQRALDLLRQQEILCDEASEEDNDDSSSSSPSAAAATAVCPDLTSYNSVMDAWAKTRTPEALPKVQALMQHMKKRNVEPDRLSFSALIEAYAYSKEENRLEDVQKIWKYIEDNEDPNVCANGRCLVALMKVYGRVAQEIRADKGRDNSLLRQLGDETMKSLRKQEERHETTQNSDDELTIHEYVAAMDVLAKLGTRESAHRAEQIWQKLDSLGIHKNIYAYSSVITAWSRVTASIPEATQRVVDLVNEIWEGDLGRPNNRPFVAALRGLSRSKFPLEEQPNKAITALHWVKRMRETSEDVRALRPNLSIYHAALDCCKTINNSAHLRAALTKDGSTTQSETTALKIAFALLQAMVSDKVTPDSDTYAKLLRCTQELLPLGDERTQIAKGVFLKAKDGGVADRRVLWAFRESVPSSYWENFILEEHLDNGQRRLDLSKIPHNWTKNVR